MARSREGIPLRPLAEKRGWNLRALYRDIEALEDAGVPVQKDGDRYRVAAEWLPPGAAGVSKAELMALFVARSLAPGLRGTRLGDLLDSMHAKLSSPGRQTVFELDPKQSVSVRALAPIDYSTHRATIELLEDAIRERRAVEIDYRRPNGDETTRVIEPGFLHWEGALEAMYVPSWCRQRDDVRNFAVHRIRHARLTDDRFVPRAETRPPALTRAFRLWYRKQLQPVAIWFAPEVAGEISERRWHPSQSLRARDGGVELRMTVTAPEELSRWILGFGSHAVVLEPRSLAESIHQIHAAAAARRAPDVDTIVSGPATGPRRDARGATTAIHTIGRRESR
jgi:proteasome accessory factor B